jgi:predicted N-acyltransferase
LWSDFFVFVNNYTFKIFTSVENLPKNWDVVSHDNIFLQTNYLQVLEKSAPVNMQCFYIGVFDEEKLIGVALAQYLDLNKLESFGERDKCLKTSIRNFVFKNFASHVLFLGNNMITGQNAYQFIESISHEKIGKLLLDCADEIISYFKKQKIKIHIVSFKDFYKDCVTEFKKNHFSETYEFNTQPNMIFEIPKTWKSKDDYIGAFSKKYRDQYKRAHKKIEGITIRELSLEETIRHENRLYELYHYVAKNAPFNTFFLANNHFSTFKKQCDDRFKIIGYFKNEDLVGFHTILLNGNTLETYFLGYNEKVQKESMLYLNMLYTMTEFAIENNFGRIIFGRTALEIKNSIGAQPVKMSGFIYHTNALVNKFLPKIFPKLEPTLVWQQRHPFK